MARRPDRRQKGRSRAAKGSGTADRGSGSDPCLRPLWRPRGPRKAVSSPGCPVQVRGTAQDAGSAGGRLPLMQGYGPMMPMMWGMGLLWLLAVVVLVLGAAALLKYLLSGRRRGGARGECPPAAVLSTISRKGTAMTITSRRQLVAGLAFLA